MGLVYPESGVPTDQLLIHGPHADPYNFISASCRALNSHPLIMIMPWIESQEKD